MDVGLAFRVLVGAVLTVAPTILFLGLWRGLMALRDDDLVNRTMNGEFGTIPDSPIAAIMFGSDAIGRERASATRAATDLVHCPRCDELNPTYAEYCHVCLQKLG